MLLAASSSPSENAAGLSSKQRAKASAKPLSASRLPTVLAEMVLDYARARPDRVAMFRNADPVWLRHSNLGLIRWDYGTGIMRFRHYRMVCRENNIILFV